MSTPQRGFSIKTFLADGEPDGLQIIEHSQWIGRGMIIPRSKFNEHAHRAENDGTGIFILVGLSNSTGVERIFVGQTAHLRERLDEIRTKSFWSRMIVLTADGQRLHRGHAEYIEARLIQIARDLKTCEVDNPETGHTPMLSEPDAADADFFCDQLVLLMPVMGVDAFKAPPALSKDQAELRLSGKGVVATGFSAGGQFIVEEGSTATRQDAESCPGHILDLRRSLLERGVLSEDGKLYRFTQDFAFDSAARAATLVLAEMSKGGAWKDPKGDRTPPGIIDDIDDEHEDTSDTRRGRARPLSRSTELKPTRVAARAER